MLGIQNRKTKEELFALNKERFDFRFELSNSTGQCQTYRNPRPTQVELRDGVVSFRYDFCEILSHYLWIASLSHQNMLAWIVILSCQIDWKSVPHTHRKKNFD